MFAVQGEAAIATTRAQLRVPGAIDDGLGGFMADLDDPADLGRIAIRPGRPADQELARIAIAGLVMPPSRRVPPELCWLGVMPSQAISWRGGGTQSARGRRSRRGSPARR